ncbi:MAG TPA: hypothetical protein VFH06_01790 [Candidatus Saccharimonadales bacterium]|nr:hypothetical protein [Candidatus Saccharimonadales bacterium]
MVKTTRPGGRRLRGVDFVERAAEFGYESGSARQAWRTVVQTIKKATYSVSAAYDESVTRVQLTDLLKSKPAQVSEEKWQLIVKVSERLLRTVTRKEFHEFGAAVDGVTPTAVGQAWNLFMRTASSMGELPARTQNTDEVELKHLETFCELMEDENNWPPNYGPTHDSLLRLWLTFITQ